jgi:Flp pilus assembly protein TadG
MLGSVRTAVRREPGARRGAAAVELAMLLPLLTLLVVICVDFGRVFYAYQTVTNCACNGAMWLSDPAAQATSKYPTLDAAVTADATNLNPSALAIVSAAGTDINNNPYVEVNVSYQFQMFTSYLGFNALTISRTVRMRVAQANPS